VATASQLSALDRSGALLDAAVRGQGQMHPAGYFDLIGGKGPQSTGTVQDLMLTAACRASTSAGGGRPSAE